MKTIPMPSSPSGSPSSRDGVLESSHHSHQCPNILLTNTAPLSPSSSSSSSIENDGTPFSRSVSAEKLVVTKSGTLPSPFGCAGKDNEKGSLAWKKGPPNKKRRIKKRDTETAATTRMEPPKISVQSNESPSRSYVKSSSASSSLNKHQEGQKSKPRNRRRRRRSISWDDSRNQIFVNPNPQSSFSDYKETDIWYSREDYDQFLVDRIRTVECLRASGAVSNDDNDDGRSNQSVSSLLSDVYCIRGLEPFQDTDTHRDMNCKRKLHKSTVMMEQARQALLGVKDPERFRFLVAPQSEQALGRAQELAAIDENDADHGRTSSSSSSLTGPARKTIHGRQHPPPRRSSMSAVRATTSSTPSSPGPESHGRSGENFNVYSCGGITSDMFPMASPDDRISSSLSAASSASSAPFLSSERIRQLQEKSMLRLMEIYSPLGAVGMGTNGDNKNNRPNHTLFRFSLRRDSLSGSTIRESSGMGSHIDGTALPGGDGVAIPRNQMEEQLAMMASRFPLRRHSLSHSGSSHR